MQGAVYVRHLPVAPDARVGGRKYGFAATLLFDVCIVGPDEVSARSVGHVLDIRGKVPWMDYVVNGRGIHGYTKPYSFGSRGQDLVLVLLLDTEDRAG